MSFAETAALGALAGFTIYLGLPAGRLQLLGRAARVGLAMFSMGVLAFIFLDVMSNAVGILHTGLHEFRDHRRTLLYVVWLVGLLGAGFVVGSAGLAVLEKRMRPLGSHNPPIAGGSTGSLTVNEADALAQELAVTRRRALRMGLTIAAAIGVHNFAEGLAIGVSARAGAISLATILIIGFALHNATEGFGIVGPLGGVRPSWRWLALAGLIGGGPTFLGSMVGYAVTSLSLELVFYSVAGGAILYVIGEVWNSMRRHGYRELGLLMLSAGFLVGVITDLVITYGGG
ncbi:MAG TPA: hypothetical protein VE983_03925 [Solirubrobacteraceae bacterium]|nr:hypothetical protein [Solirubrobacteraceae bacterium]